MKRPRVVDHVQRDKEEAETLACVTYARANQLNADAVLLAFLDLDPKSRGRRKDQVRHRYKTRWSAITKQGAEQIIEQFPLEKRKIYDEKMLELESSKAIQAPNQLAPDATITKKPQAKNTSSIPRKGSHDAASLKRPQQTPSDLDCRKRHRHELHERAQDTASCNQTSANEKVAERVSDKHRKKIQMLEEKSAKPAGQNRQEHIEDLKKSNHNLKKSNHVLSTELNQLKKNRKANLNTYSLKTGQICIDATLEEYQDLICPVFDDRSLERPNNSFPGSIESEALEIAWALEGDQIRMKMRNSGPSLQSSTLLQKVGKYLKNSIQLSSNEDNTDHPTTWIRVLGWIIEKIFHLVFWDQRFSTFEDEVCKQMKKVLTIQAGLYGLEAARILDIMTKKLVIKEEYGTKEKMEVHANHLSDALFRYLDQYIEFPETHEDELTKDKQPKACLARFVQRMLEFKAELLLCGRSYAIRFFQPGSVFDANHMRNDKSQEAIDTSDAENPRRIKYTVFPALFGREYTELPREGNISMALLSENPTIQLIDQPPLGYSIMGKAIVVLE